MVKYTVTKDNKFSMGAGCGSCKMIIFVVSCLILCGEKNTLEGQNDIKFYEIYENDENFP